MCSNPRSSKCYQLRPRPKWMSPCTSHSLRSWHGLTGYNTGFSSFSNHSSKPYGQLTQSQYFGLSQAGTGLSKHLLLFVSYLHCQPEKKTTDKITNINYIWIFYLKGRICSCWLKFILRTKIFLHFARSFLILNF